MLLTMHHTWLILHTKYMQPLITSSPHAPQFSACAAYVLEHITLPHHTATGLAPCVYAGSSQALTRLQRFAAMNLIYRCTSLATCIHLNKANMKMQMTRLNPNMALTFIAHCRHSPIVTLMQMTRPTTIKSTSEL